MKIKIAGIDETLYKETLKNGLEVYILPNDNVKNYYITFNTKFGSNDTEFKKMGDKTYTKVPNGVAHFLEHLTFKTPDGDASDYFPTLGCQSNAFTSYDVTSYEVSGYKNFKEALNYLLDYVQTPFYNEKNVQAEKGIICEEIKMREDMPNFKLQSVMFESIFSKEPYKNSVSGSVKDVKGITLKDILNCYETFYHPSNMFVIISGNVNPEEALAIIEENQSRKEFPEKFVIKRKKYREPLEVTKPINKIKAQQVEIPKVAVAWKVSKSALKNLKISKQVLNIYINLIINSNFGRSSEIKERLQSGNIVTDGPYVSTVITDDYIVPTIIAETPYPERFISIIKEGIQHITMTEEELIRKQRVAISNFIINFDMIEAISYNMMSDIIDYDDYNANIYNLYNELNITTAKKIATSLISENISVTILNKEEN